MDLHTVVALILSGVIGISLIPAERLRRMFACFVILVAVFLVAENLRTLI